MISAALHLTAAALLCFLYGDVPPLVFAASMVLALLPDIDTPKSIVGAMLRPISVRIERTVGHRTATHSVLALILVAGAAYLLAPSWWLALAGAYASHLVLDLLIGLQGITLFWPSGEFLTLTAWRDDGLAPKILLALLVPATIIAATWAQLAPAIRPTIAAAAQVANPIATPTPTKTPAPSIHLRFELPSGVGFSAVRVKNGDVIREGQILGSWEMPTPTSWAMPTSPPTLTPPALPPAPPTPAPALADSSSNSALAEAEAARAALNTTQAAARAALIAEQQRALAEAQRALAEAQRALDQLQPQHERDQAEQQHAVAQAQQAVADAQAAAALVDQGDALAIERATERAHAAETKLREALDAQDRMRTRHGIERAAAEAAVTRAQAALDALPGQQRAALARLDADQSAARMLAESRVQSARAAASDAARAQDREQQQLVATATSIAQQYQATATATSAERQAAITATAQAHQLAITATALAMPTPALDMIASHAAGRVITVSAEEKDGRLVITIELIPE
jgi:membrane-bound metal-dependent hydrolase YbcI (DUF457 family)